MSARKDVHEERPVGTYNGFLALAIGLVLLATAGWIFFDGVTVAISARQKIVHGAVSMVQMALNELSERRVVDLDDERRAAMVSNLLTVLCAESEVQPVVNTGTLYA